MEIDRRKFLQLVLTTGLGPSLIACRRTSATIPEPVEPQPSGNAPAVFVESDVQGAPAPSAECIDWTPSGECIAWEPYDECLEWNPRGECVSWEGDYMIPADECVDWDPRGECIGWGADYYYEDYGPVAECVQWNPRGECIGWDNGPVWE